MASKKSPEPSAARVLLTFTGFHDPFSQGLVAGTEQEGPILSLLRRSIFDRVVLLSTPGTREQSTATAQAVRERHPRVVVETYPLDLDDPTDYARILQQLRRLFAEVSAGRLNASYSIATASGTPQMHACWMLLVAAGEIPARLLHVRPPRFVTESKPAVSEVDLSGPDFPTIRPRLRTEVDLVELQTRNPDRVIRTLEIVGEHPAWSRIVETACLLADSEVAILIRGESGTGKELIASLIHHLSDRASGPFISVNCAAIPTHLAESVLFGHRKGAFTGASKDQVGRFEAADGGTLFLDELAELSPEVQAKLLRVLQDGLVESLGAPRPRKVKVRVVAATNRDLKEAIGKGSFRDDLYYRLSVGEILLPALRERASDIPRMALHFLDRINLGLRKPKTFSVDALSALQTYSWPGNVRELHNAVQRAAILARASTISPEDLGIPLHEEDANGEPLPQPRQGFSVEKYLREVRKRLFERALELADGNQSEAARLLGVSPQAVFKFRKG